MNGRLLGHRCRAKRQLKRGVFPCVVALQEAIHCFIATHNHEPKPFVWKDDPKAIIAAAKKGYQALDSIDRSAFLSVSARGHARS
jgi:hypothetical protein